MDSLVLLPAVDVQNGRAVQLVQGVAGSEKVFGDPLQAARRWQEDGAEWIHLVDLDAAFGRGSNAEIVAGIVGDLDISVELSARGWTREGGDVFETLTRLGEAGCPRFVVTDVASDGMLSGPNLELLGAVCARTDGKVVASGGISSLDDIRTLCGLVPIGVEGAIIGTALYVGNFTLPDALAVARDPRARVDA